MMRNHSDMNAVRGAGGVALRCSENGQITEVLRCSLDFAIPPRVGASLSEIIDRQSAEKLARFMQEVLSRGSAFDWELNCVMATQVTSLGFSGVEMAKGLLVVAVESKADMTGISEAFLSINNELVNTVRALKQNLSTSGRLVQPDNLSELMELNNELVNMQRELAKKSAEVERGRLLIQRILDTTPSAVYIFNLVEERTVYVNRGIEAMLGLASDTSLKPGPNSVAQLLDETGLSARRDAMERLLAAEDGEVIAWEFRLETETGDLHWLSVRETPFRRDESGHVIEVVGTAVDITVLKNAEEKLEQLALFDSLTGLYNRHGFGLIGHKAAEQASRTQSPVGILFTDFDDLKGINDRLGHLVGDQALKDAADLLLSCARIADVVARWGGDEFLVLTIGATPDGVERLRERLYSAVIEFNDAHERPYELGLSAGIALCSLEQTCAIDDLVEIADARMYEEKKRRKASRDRPAE